MVEIRGYSYVLLQESEFLFNNFNSYINGTLPLQQPGSGFIDPVVFAGEIHQFYKVHGWAIFGLVK